ncbi:hypothetical protein [Actinoplanes sp. HUAS TT8]|uniref:hypothetical protein n=1 Tax=Actinoplanes sp. HUAS TT8 TaxID=3447453 RepID=UPI003F51BC3E
MPRGHLHTLARQRQHYTGERFARAAKHLLMQPWAGPLPDASPHQADLEFEVLLRLGRHHMTLGHGWRHGDGPFNLSWLTPHTDAIELGVHPLALPDVAANLMPRLSPDTTGQPTGVLGLRVSHSGAGVELTRLGLPGVVRLPGIRERQWQQALAVARDDAGDTSPPVWQTHQDTLHSQEITYGPRYGTGSSRRLAATGRHPSGIVRLGSALLRRHQIFRTAPPVAGIDLWFNPGQIELEWFAGPTHDDITSALLDPVFGLSGSTSRRGCCRPSTSCYGVKLWCASAPHATVNLRRQSSGWSDSQ